MVKRLNQLHKGVRTSRAPEPRLYAAGLSFGPASSTLVHLLDDYAVHTRSRESNSPFDVLVIHVDTDLSRDPAAASGESEAERRMAMYREKYPRLTYEVIHLSQVLDVKTVAWGLLPLPGADAGSPSERLRQMFDSLPSVTAKSDVLRQLVRHLLLHRAMHGDANYSALLLGHTTTTLAALTLSEVANGRGFSVPWQVNDGPVTVNTYGETGAASSAEFRIHYPIRELFNAEVQTLISFTDPLKELVSQDGGRGTSAVVSHKDVSIDEVMTRYFESVEEPYANIVANVVRTTGKLERVAGSEATCGLCGVTLDEQGDTRWAGEIGDDESSGGHQQGEARLCYGCKRSVNG